MKRDTTLDIIKGIACVLMIFAHPKTMGYTIDNIWTTYIWHLGFFAPVLFLAGIGVSLFYQFQKRTKSEIIIANLLLLLVVFIFNGFKLDYLFTTLTLSSILTTFVFERNGLLLILVIELIDLVLNHFHPSPSLLYGNPFSVIPWAGFLLIGAYLHKHKSLVFPTFIMAFITLAFLFYKGAILEGQVPTLFYISIGVTLYAFSLLIAPLIAKIPLLNEILSFTGRNTLLFLWVHSFFLPAFFSDNKLFAPVIWVSLFVLTLISMYLFIKLNSYSFIHISKKLSFWICFFGVMIAVQSLHVWYINGFFLFVFALNYHNFTHALKSVFTYYATTDKKEKLI